MPAQECAVQQRPFDEVVGVGMLLVEPADLRCEPTQAQLQASGKGAGLDPGLLDLGLELAIVGVCGERELCRLGAAQRPAQRDVAVPEAETLVALPESDFARRGGDVEHAAKLPSWLAGLGLRGRRQACKRSDTGHQCEDRSMRE